LDCFNPEYSVAPDIPPRLIYHFADQKTPLILLGNAHFGQDFLHQAPQNRVIRTFNYDSWLYLPLG
jgi:hypothetical protein